MKHLDERQHEKLGGVSSGDAYAYRHRRAGSGAGADGSSALFDATVNTLPAETTPPLQAVAAATGGIFLASLF